MDAISVNDRIKKGKSHEVTKINSAPEHRDSVLDKFINAIATGKQKGTWQLPTT